MGVGHTPDFGVTLALCGGSPPLLRLSPLQVPPQGLAQPVPPLRALIVPSRNRPSPAVRVLHCVEPLTRR